MHEQGFPFKSASLKHETFIDPGWLEAETFWVKFIGIKKSVLKKSSYLARPKSKKKRKNSFGLKYFKAAGEDWFLGSGNTHFPPPVLLYSLSPMCFSDALRAWLSLDISVIVMHSRREH